MSFLDYLKLNSSLTWQQTDFTNDTIILEQGKLSLTTNISSGTGAGQLNKVFFDANTLASGQNFQYDLFNLTRSVFGENLNISFSGDNVKLFIIENTSTGLNNDLFICSTGLGGFTQMFGYGYLGWLIKPQSYSIFFDRNIGYPINTGERYFYLSDINNTAPSYEIGIFGVDFE